MLSFEEWPYVWVWDKWPRHSWPWEDDPAWDGKRIPPGGYKGMVCRVLIRSRASRHNGKPFDMNTALVEFENGDQIVTSRRGLRRRKEA